jgi:hypothetical protein
VAETDRRGLTLSTTSAAAAEHYRAGVEYFLRGQPGAADHFVAACAADPGFVEGHVGAAFSALYDGDVDGAARHLAAAEQAGDDPRGRGQLTLVQTLSQLDVRQAERVGRDHLEQFPLDDLAREALGLVLFFVGRSDTIVDLYDWLAPEQGDDWGFAASWSFACHEVGRLDQSSELGQLALVARPDHVFATHSLAHVAYERGAHDEGAALVRRFFAAHDAIAFQRRHLRWHLTLNLLALDGQAEVPALWAETLAEPAAQTSPGALEDGASLLWRWHLYDLDGWPLPWEALGEQARTVAALPVIPLPAASAAIVLAALGDEDALATLVRTAASMEGSGMAVPAAVLAAVADAARASFRGQWDAVADALVGVQGRFAEIGGSRAQRELLSDALIVGLLRSGRVGPARALLGERLGRRPSARDVRWAGAAT